MSSIAKGAIFEISAHGATAWCKVLNRPDVGPEEGARCAQEIQEFVAQRIHSDGAEYRSLVLDVREAPVVFGPKTSASLKLLFSGAEARRQRVAVVVSEAPLQGQQFRDLVRDCAPTFASVFRDEHRAVRWLGE
jgi:hypothetical protein